MNRVTTLSQKERNKMTTYETNQKQEKATTQLTPEVGGAQPLTEQLLMKKPSTMKHRRIPAPGLAACAVLFAGLTVASAQVNVPPPHVADAGKDIGFYVNGDVGPSFMPDFQSSRFGFPGNFRMDTGVRSDGEVGYNFLATRKLTLGGEFETGAIYNRISHVWDAGSARSLRGDYYQVPLLNNLVLTFHPNSFCVPYVGVGGGADCSFARINSPGFLGCRDHSDKVDPAAQGLAGVRFRINSKTDAGLGYKFLADFPDKGKYIATHAVTASIQFKF
jgi:opacity protein-like surface antigen